MLFRGRGSCRSLRVKRQGDPFKVCASTVKGSSGVIGNNQICPSVFLTLWKSGS